jgi:hypothetical protein
MTFRIAFLLPFAIITGQVLAGWISIMLLFFVFLELFGRGVGDPYSALKSLLCGMAMGEILTLLLTLFRILKRKTHIGPAGIAGYSAWGKYEQMAWQDMVAVKPFNFFGLKYLHVYSQDQHRPLWVPLFLADMQGFEDAVHAWAGLDNSLAASLRKAQDVPVIPSK